MRFYIVIFMLSASTIAFEITLARIFSYILTYHFVFLIIAFAILSYSLGEFYASKLSVIKKFSFTKYLTLLQIVYPLSLSSIFLLSSVPLLSAGSTGLILYSLFAGAVFFSIGIICANIFQKNGGKSIIIYAVDSIGAAIGSLAGLFLLNNFDLVPVLAIILTVISVTTFFLYDDIRRVKRWQLITTVSVLIVSFSIIFIAPRIEFNAVQSMDKDLFRIKSNPSIRTEYVDSKFNSFGRTDLVRFYYPDSTSSLSMFIDGAAGTQVVSIGELEKDSTKLFHALFHSNLFFPFNFLKDQEKESALIIGPGGGYDIAIAYFGGAQIIDAAEVNPTFVEMMKRHNQSTFNEQANVNVMVREGRNYVRNTNKKYDLIFLTIPITKGVRSSDFINLTENYLFTQEALKDYLKILTNEGRILFTVHNSEEVYRLLSNYLSVMNNSGIKNSEAFKYFYIIDQGMQPLLVIKKTPFAKEEIALRHYVSHRLKMDQGTTFFPFIKQIEIDTVIKGNNYRWSMFDKVLEDISQNKYDFHELTDKAMINLHPVSDDSPFFFNYELGIPQNLNGLLIVGIMLVIWMISQAKNNWGVSYENTAMKKNNELMFKYISLTALLLGFGYILAESYIFQILYLNLANPVESFSILLFSFLLGNGAGSYTINYVKKNRLNIVIVSIALLLLSVLIEIIFIVPNLIDTNSVTLMILVFIPAYFIGMPLPILLKETAEGGDKNGLTILLGISGAAGFLGSITTLMVATIWGYKYVLMIAGIIYFASIIVCWKIESIKQLTVSREF